MALAIIVEIAPQTCRFALVHDDGDVRPVFSHPMELTVSDYAGVEAAFAHYLSTIDMPWPSFWAWRWPRRCRMALSPCRSLDGRRPWTTSRPPSGLTALSP